MARGWKRHASRAGARANGICHRNSGPAATSLKYADHIKEATLDTSQISDSPAVAVARAHIEAWTNHDLEKARGNLADDVQFFSPAANLVGIDEYMDAPRGLAQFAKQVVPGSLRLIAATGDDRNALIMYEVRTAGGQFGPRLFPSAQTWVLDERGKIRVERIVSIVIPLTLV